MELAKRWLPILAACTGARGGELAQLRKEDVRKAGKIHFVRITPGAGSVKSDIYRDVPLHLQKQIAGLCQAKRAGVVVSWELVRFGAVDVAKCYPWPLPVNLGA